MASSRPSVVQSGAPGARYWTLVSRWLLVTSWKVACPFGHSRPRDTGEPSVPSIASILPSRTWTVCAQPVAQ